MSNDDKVLMRDHITDNPSKPGDDLTAVSAVRSVVSGVVGVALVLALTPDHKPYTVLDVTTQEADMERGTYIGPETHHVFYLNRAQSKQLRDELTQAWRQDELMAQWPGPNVAEAMNKWGDPPTAMPIEDMLRVRDKLKMLGRPFVTDPPPVEDRDAELPDPTE